MTKFWLVDPTVLMKEGDVSSVWPSTKMDTNEKLNAITRLTIILTITGYILTKKLKILVSGIVTVVAIVILYHSYGGGRDSSLSIFPPVVLGLGSVFGKFFIATVT